MKIENLDNLEYFKILENLILEKNTKKYLEIENSLLNLEIENNYFLDNFSYIRKESNSTFSYIENNKLIYSNLDFERIMDIVIEYIPDLVEY